jgi:hypothetical protein
MSENQEMFVTPEMHEIKEIHETSEISETPVNLETQESSILKTWMAANSETPEAPETAKTPAKK